MGEQAEEPVKAAEDTTGPRSDLLRLLRVGFERDRSSRRPALPTGPARASVLAVLRHSAHQTEVLLIRRAVRPDDPWSGQMALPGGHREVQDIDEAATALRELREEVGLETTDLEGPPVYMETRSPANRPDLPVAVFVAVLRSDVHRSAVPGKEVAEAVWIPLRDLSVPWQTLVPTPRGPLEVLATGPRSHLVWGFTRKVLADLLDVIPEVLT